MTRIWLSSSPYLDQRTRLGLVPRSEFRQHGGEQVEADDAAVCAEVGKGATRGRLGRGEAREFGERERDVLPVRAERGDREEVSVG